MLRRASFALTLITGYFLTSLLSVHVFIFGSLIGLLSLRAGKFLFSLASGSNNRGAQVTGLMIQVLCFLIVLGFTIMTPNLEYKHLMINIGLTTSIILIDLLLIDPIQFGLQVALAKIAPKSCFVKVFVPKEIQSI